MSSRRRQYESLEEMLRKNAWSAQIAQRDPDFKRYSGASLEDGERLAKIDVFLKYGLIPKELEAFVRLYRAFLNQRRKAFFASVSSEVTKLGFMLGVKDHKIRAVRKEFH